MTIAYWCVLVAMMLPYGLALAAKAGSPAYDNRAPREFLAAQVGWRKRANWAQLNAFEAFAPFAVGVVIAHQRGAPQTAVDLLAMAFIAFRVSHGIFYIADRSTLRSLAWTAAFACVVALFVISI